MDPISFVAMLAVEAVVNFGISYLFPSQGPRLKDLRVSASSYGAAIPQIYGTARAAGNMIWSTPIKEHKSKKQAGKGGSYEDYTYTCSMAFGFAMGPIESIDRIWANGKLIYDTTGASETINNGKYKFRTYFGDETQVPDPLIEADKGVGNTPAYRGLAYIVFENFLLTDFGNMIPQFAAQVTAFANNTVPYTNLTVKSGDVLTNISSNGTFPNWGADLSRGLIWATGTDGGSESGLRCYNMTTGVETNQVLAEQIGFDTLTLLGVGPAGDIFVTGPIQNTAVIARLDPVSQQIMATAGNTASFPDGVLSWSPPWLPAVFANDGATFLYFDYPTEDGLLGIHDLNSCLRLSAVPTLRTSLFSKTVCGACPRLTSGYAILSMPDADHLALIDETGATIHEDSLPGVNGRWCAWDSGTNGIIYAYDIKSGNPNAGSYIAKYSTDTASVVWTTKVTANSNISGNSRIQQGEIAWAASGHAYLINTVDGSFVDRDADVYAALEVWEVPNAAFQANNDGSEGWPIPSDTPGTGTGGPNDGVQLYDSLRQALVCVNNNISDDTHLGGAPNRIVYAGLGGGAETTLEAVVEAMLRQGGLTSEDFDLSAMSDIAIRGYGFANATDIKGVLSELRMIYLFDLFESDFILKARIRGSSVSDETIDARVLGSSSPEATDYWKQTRIQEADLPAKITLAYMDVNNDFQASTASYQRPSDPIPTMFSKQQAQIEANLVMDATEAKNRVRTMVFTQWAERVKHDTRLPWAYLYLDPSDLITVNLQDGRSYFERIESTDLGADLSITSETFGQDAGAYAVNPRIVGDGGGSGITQTVVLPKPARPFIMNTPLLRDGDDLGGAASRYYVALGNDGGQNSTFFGGIIFRSTNNDDYADIAAEPSDVEWGAVVGVVPPPSHGSNALDWETQITIYPAISWFTLESITDDELWAGQNLIIIGQEVLQFRDAVQNENGTWTISNLLRGRRGTEWAAYIHGPGEEVIAPSTTTVDMVNETLDAKGQNRWYKGVAQGLSLPATAPVEIKYYPRDLMPYAVAQIQRVFDPITGDCTITWKRRTRFSATMQDGTGDVPLGEASEAYEVYILPAAFDGDVSTNEQPAAFTRFAATTTSTYVYSAADQTTDAFTLATDTLHVAIFQVSAAVGRGFPSSRDIEEWRDT